MMPSSADCRFVSASMAATAAANSRSANSVTGFGFRNLLGIAATLRTASVRFLAHAARQARV